MGEVLWFTGLSGSGKTTLAVELQKELHQRGKTVKILDGDDIRDTFHTNLGFSREDIRKSNNFAADLANKFIEEFDFVIVPIISPYNEDRTTVRSKIRNFTQVFINAPLEECARRDVKGLYQKAFSGEINNMIGVAESNPYEEPKDSEIEIETKKLNIKESVGKILSYLDVEENKMELPFEAREETKIAIEAALNAGKEVLEIYNRDFSTTIKEDKEPLTEADLKSNEIILEALSSTSYPILSEESDDDSNRLSSREVWIIDPLDGTSDFVNKTGDFSIMIGFVEEHVPTIGVVYKPDTNELFVAEKGKGAYLVKDNVSKRLNTNNNENLTAFRAVVSRHHLGDKEKSFLSDLGISDYRKKGSCGLKVAEICADKAEIYFTTTNKIKQWDSCAAHCLISEAGGKMTDMFGNEIRYNTENINHMNGLLVTNGVNHSLIAKKYQEKEEV